MVNLHLSAQVGYTRMVFGLGQASRIFIFSYLFLESFEALVDKKKKHDIPIFGAKIIWL